MSREPSSVSANRLCVAIAAALLVVSPLRTARCAERGPDATPTTLTLAGVRAAILAAHDRIKSVYVECRCDYPDNGKFPKGTVIHRTIACKRPGMFFCSTAKGHARLDWHDDPRWQRWYVSGGKFQWELVRWRAYSEGACAADGPLPGDTEADLFLLATGIWPFDQRVGPTFPSGAHAALRDVANDADYVLRPVQEIVESHPCHVLEKPGDTLWIDASRGCALLLREIRRTGTSALASRFELREHRRVADGVWIPGLIHNIQYGSQEVGDAPRKLRDSVVKVAAAHANDVSDDLFHFEPPAGALQLDPTHEHFPVQTRPGGLEHLDDLADWILRTGLGPRDPNPAWTPLVAFAAGAVLGLVALAAMRRPGPRWVRGCIGRAGVTLMEVLVVISIIGMLMALLLPAVQASRESARRNTCKNHVKQFGLAMLNHESAKGCFPSGGWGFAWVGDADRGTGVNQPGGWIYSILPYLERTDLARLGAGQTNPKKKAAASELVQIPLEILHCPSKGPLALSAWDPTLNPANFNVVAAFAQSDYAANGGDTVAKVSAGPPSLAVGDSPSFHWPDTSKCDGIVYLRSQVVPAQVRDGLSRTYLAGEKHVLRGIPDPGDDQCAYSGYDYDTIRWTADAAPPLPDGGHVGIDRFGGSHPFDSQFVFCDGSVRGISFQIDPEVHRRLGNRQDQLPIDDSKLQ